VNYIMGA